MLEARHIENAIFDPFKTPWIFERWHKKIAIVPVPATCRIYGRPWPVGGDCCCWTGANDGKKNGRVHGKIKLDGKWHFIHRYALACHLGVEMGSLNNVDHLCRNSTCFNPYHLEDVSGKENTNRGDGSPITRFSSFYQPAHNEDHKGLTAEDIAALSGDWKTGF